MKAKKVWATLLCGAMAVGSLAGCGGSETSDTKASDTAAPTTQETKKVTLKVWGTSRRSSSSKRL